MKNKTIILAYSGGLDTSFCLKRLSSDGFDVHATLVNTCLLYTSPSPRDA